VREVVVEAQKPPPRNDPAMIRATKRIRGVLAGSSIPIAPATIDPANICPSAPTFHILDVNGRAAASPVSARIEAIMRV